MLQEAIFLQPLLYSLEADRLFLSTLGNYRNVVKIFEQPLVLFD